MYDENPLKPVLLKLYRREQKSQAKLKRLMDISDGFGHLQIETLLANYEKQSKRLEKISRISDRYQENMRELNEKLKTTYRQLQQNHLDLERVNSELEQKIAIIERLSITDELTQLYNRRHFNTLFPKEIQRAARENQNVSFLIFDVDYFKQYNDNYGHQKGDAVLRTIGLVLKMQCQRASDVPFRLGGEEFGVIFLNLNQTDAVNFADRVRVAIEQMQIEHLFSSVAKHITASFGLVTLPANLKLTMDDFYRQADEALYQAKKQGRNKVIQLQHG
jgi:diguanylate cyclase (GGDEF)-like protein